MFDLARTFAAAGLIALAMPAGAQENGQTGTPPAPEAGATEPSQGGGPISDEPATPDNPAGLNMGEPVEDPEAPGTIYVRDTFDDWELRCTRMPEGQAEPCLIYQLLTDDKGNPVAEFTMFQLPEGQKAAAGATIVTPLETLLTRQLTLSVDGGAKKRYPFTWCALNGCYARIGFSQGDVTAFKRGARATITIVPVVAPDQEIDLTVSLKGFTRAYEAVGEANRAEAAAAAGNGNGGAAPRE